jgi:hypothetical protein
VVYGDGVCGQLTVATSVNLRMLERETHSGCGNTSFVFGEEAGVVGCRRSMLLR